MGQLEDMNMFIRVVDAGGISRAAEQLGLAKSAVSRRLVDLESRLTIFFNDFVNASWTISLRRFVVFGQVEVDRDRFIFQS